MRLRRAIAHVDFVVRGFEQRFADGGRQALTHDDRIALAVLEAFHANLLLLARKGRVRRARHRDVGCEIRLAGERLGKIEAHPGRSRLVVHLVIDDAEAVLLPEILVDLARVLVVATVEARAIGVEGGAPGLVPREEIAEQGERLGLGGGGARAAVGGVGGGLAARDHIVTPVRLRIVRLRAELGEREPCAGVLRIGGDRRAEKRAGVLESLVGDRRRRILAQLIRGLALDLRPDLRGLFAQRFREPDDVAREILAGIRLDVRGPGRSAEGDEHEGEKAAKRNRHGPTPVRPARVRAAVLLPHRNYVASTTVLAPRPMLDDDAVEPHKCANQGPAGLAGSESA